MFGPFQQQIIDPDAFGGSNTFQCIATRRTLFGTMGAMLLLAAAEAGPAKAAELDGNLLACCAEALAIDRELDRLWDNACPEEFDHLTWGAFYAHTDATGPRWHDLAAEIAATPARTTEGLRAKAAVARSAMPGDRVDDPEAGDRLVLSLLGDILGRAMA